MSQCGCITHYAISKPFGSQMNIYQQAIMHTPSHTHTHTHTNHTEQLCTTLQSLLVRCQTSLKTRWSHNFGWLQQNWLILDTLWSLKGESRCGRVHCFVQIRLRLSLWETRARRSTLINTKLHSFALVCECLYKTINNCMCVFDAKSGYGTSHTSPARRLSNRIDSVKKLFCCMPKSRLAWWTRLSFGRLLHELGDSQSASASSFVAGKTQTRRSLLDVVISN